MQKHLAKDDPSIMQNQKTKTRSMPNVRRALIIEDDLQSQSTCRRQLLLEGYQVHTADSARQGMLKAKRLAPDVILVDLMLRPSGGKDILSLLRQDPLTRDIPIAYILTWQNEVGKVVKAAQRGLKRPPNNAN